MSWPCDQREEPAPQSSVCSVLCAIIFVLCALCYNLCAMLGPLSCLLCSVCCVLAVCRLCAVCCLLYSGCVQAVCRLSTIWLQQQPVMTSNTMPTLPVLHGWAVEVSLIVQQMSSCQSKISTAKRKIGVIQSGPLC